MITLHTPPRPSYDSPMLTPSPLRARNADDMFFNSPYKPRPITPEDADAAVFLASPTKPLLTPAKRVRSRTPLLLNTNTTGTKRKSSAHTTTSTPLRLAPLTSPNNGSVAFHRLAPLPAPKFNARTPQTIAEADAHLRSHTATLTRLSISDLSGEFDLDDDSPPAPSRPEEVVEASSPGGHITKRRARSRPVSQELLEASPSPVSVAFPSALGAPSRSPSSASSSETGSPLPRRRITGAYPSRAPLERIESAATLFFGPPINPPPRSRLSSATSAKLHPLANNTRPSGRHSYAGPGCSTQSWNTMQDRPTTPSPRSSPPAAPHDLGDNDEQDMFFGASHPDPSFSFSVTADTPSPRTRRPNAALAKKFNLRDSGVALSEDDDDAHLSVMPRASTSVSSIYSDEGLVTPGLEPEVGSGWPNIVVSENGDLEGGVDVDAFIRRTLAAGSKGAGLQAKKAPDTPVKRVKTSYLTSERPWQSAVAHKVGLAGFSWDGRQGKAPRKSLPAVFPALGRKGGKAPLDPSTDSEGEDDSPSGGRREKYIGLGLGRPAAKGGVSRARWLMRRSSSGAFSSGSDTASIATTPTRAKGHDWHLPKPFSPSNNALNLSPGRSASIERTGHFERDFEELEQLGSGEFGQVIKVRSHRQSGTEVFAVKKSKRFEGVRHRLRLREEVEILQHLACGGVQPNVLTFVDSWEEDDVLYIQTELCELGNFAHFLWEYGRVFPRLDEARIWKIIVDLSNGLQFIHDAGVIHLDLKPSNIFVTGEGRFKIGDFGMASVWPRPAANSHQLETESVGFEREGDKVYLAPEVLQGRYGKAADVFSFGMTMLETASNIVVPDQGDAWLRLRAEDFSQIDMGDRPELFELIQEMMRTDPSIRIRVDAICGHPVVSRARIRMERDLAAAVREGGSLFRASPLGAAPEGFLCDILGRMDVRM
ncbi:kinase-like domain-containing protein [Mycena rebaudengoi]|nr:kinase-like domain-containing protein [Mycena rebaudengoi]